MSRRARDLKRERKPSSGVAALAHRRSAPDCKQSTDAKKSQGSPLSSHADGFAQPRSASLAQAAGAYNLR